MGFGGVATAAARASSNLAAPAATYGLVASAWSFGFGAPTIATAMD
jgi:hypothetical protein